MMAQAISVPKNTRTFRNIEGSDLDRSCSQVVIWKTSKFSAPGGGSEIGADICWKKNLLARRSGRGKY
jgi:hypothetical protein